MLSGENMDNFTALYLSYVHYALLFFWYLLLVFFPAFFYKFKLFDFGIKDCNYGSCAEHRGHRDRLTRLHPRVNQSPTVLSLCVGPTSRNSAQYSFNVCLLLVKLTETNTINWLFFLTSRKHTECDLMAITSTVDLTELAFLAHTDSSVSVVLWYWVGSAEPKIYPCLHTVGEISLDPPQKWQVWLSKYCAESH